MFIAHTNDINDGSYKPVDQLNQELVIVCNNDYKLVSNICPHQQSKISNRPGEGNRTCPYHNWTFDLSGEPLTSGRTAHYCKNTYPLDSSSVYEFNNLLFSTPVFSESFNQIDLSMMQLKEYRVDTVDAPPEIIMDLFLDVDHIETLHRGVYNKIGLSNINNVEWEYFDWGSLQTVKNASVAGAAWLAVYPYSMIEWQKGALFVTVCSPKITHTAVHVFKYSDDETLWNLNEDVWETAWSQDKHQAEIIKKLPEKNLEESKIHFRKYSKKYPPKRVLNLQSSQRA
jgi:nitrite reductase/ring-hydroxylating ferredoxin subunit